MLSFDHLSVIQNIFSRPSTFDGSMGMYMLDDVVELRPPQIWLNVQVNVISVISWAFSLLILYHVTYLT